MRVTHTHASFFHKHQYIANAPALHCTRPFGQQPNRRPRRPARTAPSARATLPERLRTAAAAPAAQHGPSLRTPLARAAEGNGPGSETATSAKHAPAAGPTGSARPRETAPARRGSSWEFARPECACAVSPAGPGAWEATRDPGCWGLALAGATAECGTGSVWV